MPWYVGNGSMMSAGWFGWGVIPFAIWSLLWTGLALWYAAQRREKWWFILFLLVHTLGILEMIYLLFVARAFSQKKSSRRQRR
jgi:hypothetical protein